jgi:hypothetical protein
MLQDAIPLQAAGAAADVAPFRRRKTGSPRLHLSATRDATVSSAHIAPALGKVADEAVEDGFSFFRGLFVACAFVTPFWGVLAWFLFAT